MVIVGVSKPGVDEGPPVLVASKNIVVEVGSVTVTLAVLDGVGVGVIFPGVSVQANQPTQ